METANPQCPCAFAATDSYPKKPSKAYSQPLDRFYTAIEKAAESRTGYTEEQHFLNAVYEKFFQRFDTNQADNHGMVPQKAAGL